MINRHEKAGIYVHYPYCKKKCDYCAFASQSDFSTQGRYIEALKWEIFARGQGQEADTIYFGGGTPSAMRRGAIAEIAAAINAAFRVELKEFTVEANPESATDEFFDECESAGVTRISMGLQAYSDKVLRAVGRLHSRAGFIEAAKKAAERFDLACDLIVGLPGQDEDDPIRAARLFAELGAGHVSAYMLSVEEGTPLFKSGFVADDDRITDMWERTAAELRSLGYERYEVSNFARNGKRAVHNGKYWTGADYFGFGAAAHSLVGGVRRENTNDIGEYIAGNRVKDEYLLSDEDKREEMIMLRLRTAEGLDTEEVRYNTGESIFVTRGKELKELSGLGLIEFRGNSIVCTDKGFLLLNSVIAKLI